MYIAVRFEFSTNVVAIDTFLRPNMKLHKITLPSTEDVIFSFYEPQGVWSQSVQLEGC